MLWLGMSSPAFFNSATAARAEIQAFRTAFVSMELRFGGNVGNWLKGCSACQVMFKFPVYIDINELLGQFMSIRSTYQFYMSIFCFFFDMIFLCVDTLDISTLKPSG